MLAAARLLQEKEGSEPPRIHDHARPAADLWAGAEADEEQAEGLVASPDALYEVKRIAALELGYPDGTLHPAAEALLAWLLTAHGKARR